MAEILFVDDEEVILFVAEGVFADEGIEIITTQDPREALHLVKSKEISVIVSDNRMPSMLGIDLLAEVMHASPDTVKILMTGYADLQTALDAIEKVGAFRVIVKPWENDQLVEVIKQAVSRYELKLNLRQGDQSCIPTVIEALQITNQQIFSHTDNLAVYSALISIALGRSDSASAEFLNKARALMSEDMFRILNDSHNGTPIPFHKRIRVIASIFDILTTRTYADAPLNTGDAIETLGAMKDEVQDSDMIDLLISMVISSETT